MADLGISLLIGFGTNLLLSILTPQPTIEGPRLNDLRKPSSEYGRPIPKIYGRARITGNLIWAKDIREESETSGGKGGGGGRSRTYTYYGTFAILFCEGEVHVKQVYLDGNLVYNSDSTDEGTIEANDRFLDKFEFYSGTPDQLADPTIEATEGIDNTPAYRGLAYGVFKDIPLKDYGNRFPVVSAVVESVYATESLQLGNVLKEICLAAGIPSDYLIDSELALADIEPRGIIIPQDGERYREPIEQLQQFYFFYLLEGNVLEFRLLQNAPSVVDIGIDDLGCRSETEELLEEYENILTLPLEIPSSLSLTFNNYELDYNKDTLTFNRVDVVNDNHKEVKTEISSNKERAAIALRKLLSQSWIQRAKYQKLRLPPFFLGRIYPGSVLKFYEFETAPPPPISIQVHEVTIGANYCIEVQGVICDPTSLEEVEPIGDLISDPGTISSPGDSTLIVVEAFTDDAQAEVGVFVGVNTISAWSYGEVYFSRAAIDGDYSFAFEVSQKAIIGSVTGGGLSNTASPFLIDKISKIQVTLSSGTDLSSIPEFEFLRLTNLALIGSELVAFQNAVLVSEGVYELSIFCRGCKGTDWAIASHTGADNFILLSNQISRHEGIVSDIGQDWYFKLSYSGADLAIAAPVNVRLTGVGFKPWSPTHIRAYRNYIPDTPTSNDIKISWFFRTPKYGEWVDNRDTPIEANATTFLVEILLGVTVKRSWTVNALFVIYKATEQLSDFGSFLSNITVRVTQISGHTGNGFSTTKTLIV